MASEDESEHRFGGGEPFSIGVEEELFLVDPATGAQINSSGAVLERLGSVRGEVARELHACQVELITEVHTIVAEAVSALAAMRRAARATGAGLLAAGTHPTAAEGDAEITEKERYEHIRYLLGDAAATPISGLHIHVGMPDPDTAMRVFNGLRRDLPLLQALAANSPFRHGRDTGLASAREVTLRGWARSGTPRAMRDFADFCEMARVLSRAADVEDYTWFWWKLRPHPGWEPWRSGRSTCRRGLVTRQLWWRSSTAWRGTRPQPGPASTRLPSWWRRASSVPPGSERAASFPISTESFAQSQSSWRRP